MTATAEDKFISTLYAEHAHGLTRFVVGLVAGDQSAADDVVQETFIRAPVLQAQILGLKGS